MKKTASIFNLLVIMLLACAFTSCERDEDTDR